MKDSQKSKQQLIEELALLRQELASLAAPPPTPPHVKPRPQEPDGTYYQIFLTSPDIFFIADPTTGTYVEVNDSFVKNTGYSRKEMVGHSVVEVNLFANPDEFIRINRLLVERGRINNEEFSIRTKAGKIRRWLTSAYIININGTNRLIAVATDITARQQTEQELILQRDFAQSIFNTAPAIMLVLDPQGRIVSFNHYLEEISGYRLKEVKGKDWFDIFVPEAERAATRQGFERAINTVRTKGNINPILTKDGRQRQIEWYDQILQDLNGEVIGLLAVGQDITERTHEEERHRAILSTTIEGFWLTDLKGNFLQVNDSYCDMIGYTRKELQNMSVSDIEAAETPRDIKRHMDRIIHHGAERFETKHRRKDGTVIDVEVSTNYLNIGEGQISIFIRDITQRKQAEEALRQSEEKFSKAFRSSPDSIVITTLDEGRVIEANDSYLRTSGYTRAEVIGHTMYELNSWWEVSQREKIVRQLKKQGRIFNEEVNLRLKSGDVRASLFSAELINIDGQECMISVATDITARKKMVQLLQDENYILTLLGHDAKLHELLDAIVRMGEKHDPSIKGLILLYNPVRQRLFPASGPNIPAEHIESMKDGVPIGPTRGSVGTAAFTKKQVIVPDIVNSPFYRKYQKMIKSLVTYSLLACWTLPILSQNGELLGTITNYSSRTGEPAADSIRVLEWSARIAAIAIERKQAEEQIAVANERLQYLLNSSPSVIYSTKATSPHNPTFISDNITQFIGYRPQEIIDNPDIWLKSVHPEDLKRIFTQEYPVLFENGQHSIEYRLKRKDGKYIWIREDIILVRNKDGEPLEMVGNWMEITERKQAEEAIRESEEKFSKAFHSSPESMVITSEETGRYIDVNESFTRLTGFNREEVIGLSPDDLNVWHNKSDRQRMRKMLRQKARINNEEFSFLHKSGRLLKLMMSAERIEIDGEACILSVSTDITQRKQAEEALKNSEARLQAILRSSPLGIVLFQDRTALWVNDHFCKMTGYSADELVGESSRKLYASDEEYVRVGELKDLELELYGKSEIETQFVCKDGKVIDVLIMPTYLNHDDLSAGIIATIMDITERKQAEERERETVKLRDLDRLRTELLANVSHELRTPLASIKGFTTVLMDYDTKLESDEKHEYLEIIDHNTDRLSELIEQLLVMSRLGAGLLTIEREPSNLRHLYRDIIAEARVRSPEYEFILDLPSRLLRADIDSKRIRQVLDNIIDNAVKHSEAGSPITVSARRHNDEIVTMVADRGTGIAKQDLPRLFDRMFHAERKQKTGATGAGLGLSICKGLVEAHQGKIWIESEEGTGTRCFFTLPVYKD